MRHSILRPQKTRKWKWNQLRKDPEKLMHKSVRNSPFHFAANLYLICEITVIDCFNNLCAPFLTRKIDFKLNTAPKGGSGVLFSNGDFNTREKIGLVFFIILWDKVILIKSEKSLFNRCLMERCSFLITVINFQSNDQFALEFCFAHSF